MTTMLYKSPGSTVRRDGKSFGWVIVNDDQVEEAVADGWHRTPAEAIAATTAPADDAGEKDEKPKRGRPRKVEG